VSKHAEALRKLRWELVDHDDKAQMAALDHAIGLVEAATSSWKLIDTAPKDGSYILAAGCKNGPSIRIVHWGNGEYQRSSKTFQKDWVDGTMFGLAPTLWMPFPALPAQQGNQL
jgi:hypothetical protein